MKCDADVFTCDSTAIRGDAESMVALNLSLISVCSGGNHYKVGLSVDGGPVKAFDVELPNFSATPTEEDDRQLVACLLKYYAIGKTAAQINSGLAAEKVVPI